MLDTGGGSLSDIGVGMVHSISRGVGELTNSAAGWTLDATIVDIMRYYSLVLAWYSNRLSFRIRQNHDKTSIKCYDSTDTSAVFK